jgi:hypothetical protein
MGLDGDCETRNRKNKPAITVSENAKKMKIEFLRVLNSEAELYRISV